MSILPAPRVEGTRLHKLEDILTTVGIKAKPRKGWLAPRLMGGWDENYLLKVVKI